MHNLRMRFFSLEVYKKNYGDNIYEGSFIELFKFYSGKYMSSDEKASGDYSITYKNKGVNSSYNSITYTYPSVRHDGREMLLKADGVKTCRTLGYLGAVPKLTLLKCRIIKPSMICIPILKWIIVFVLLLK